MMLCRFLSVLSLFLAFSAQASPTPATPRPDLPPDDGTSNLWQAAYSGDLDTLRRLIDAGASIDAFSPTGTTPLLYALKHNRFAAAEWLLSHGANPSQVSSKGFSPLSYAFWAGVNKNDPEIFDDRWLRLLLDRGADPLASSKYREPLLFQVAAYYPPQPKALRFVLSYNLPVDQPYENYCRTALSEVVLSESSDKEAKNGIVRLLLAGGANPNVSWLTNNFVGGKRNYPTPLIRASYGFVYEMGKSTVNARDKEARLELINILLDAGADARFGGIGSRLRLPAECVEIPEGSPGSSSSAGPSWSDFPDEQANPALSEIIGNVSSFRPALDRLVSAALPIAAGEIGYPALEAALARYSSPLTSLERTALDMDKGNSRAAKEYPELLERKADLEYALARLLELRTRVNPEHVLLSEEGTWDDLWLARKTRRESGISSLPLFEHRMPDILYEAFLLAGANPALRKGDHFDDQSSLITHLIRHQAASKLELLRHPR